MSIVLLDVYGPKWLMLDVSLIPNLGIDMVLADTADTGEGHYGQTNMTRNVPRALFQNEN